MATVSISAKTFAPHKAPDDKIIVRAACFKLVACRACSDKILTTIFHWNFSKIAPWSSRWFELFGNANCFDQIEALPSGSLPWNAQPWVLFGSASNVPTKSNQILWHIFQNFIHSKKYCHLDIWHCQRPVVKMLTHAILKNFLKKSKIFEMSKNESPTHKTCSSQYLDIFNFLHTFHIFWQHCTCRHFHDRSLTMSNITVTICLRLNEILQNMGDDHLD